MVLPQAATDVIMPNRPGVYALGRGDPLRIECLGDQVQLPRLPEAGLRVSTASLG